MSDIEIFRQGLRHNPIEGFQVSLLIKLEKLDWGSILDNKSDGQETVAAQDMLTRFAEWQGRAPESVAADTTCGNGEFLQWLADRNITPYMRTRDSIHRKRSPFFGPDRFTYEPEHDRSICPAGQPLNYGGQSHRNHAWTYIGTRKRCGPCALRPQCTSAAFRGLVIHQHEPARQRARELANTPEFVKA
jgi:hypothetical protein